MYENIKLFSTLKDLCRIILTKIKRFKRCSYFEENLENFEENKQYIFIF